MNYQLTHYVSVLKFWQGETFIMNYGLKDTLRIIKEMSIKLGNKCESNN